MIQHPASYSQNQKPGCSSTAAHVPSLHFESGNRFIKWSGAQNRVSIVKFETLLVNFIWTWYYDEVHRDLPQRRRREHRVSIENLGASCVHSQVYSFYWGTRVATQISLVVPFQKFSRGGQHKVVAFCVAPGFLYHFVFLRPQ